MLDWRAEKVAGPDYECVLLRTGVLAFFPAKNALYFSTSKPIDTVHTLELAEGSFAQTVVRVFDTSGTIKHSASRIRTGLPPALEVVRMASVHLPASITMWRSRNLSRPICNGRKSTDAW